ncbi:DUF2026 family protein [Noviherbaspirillum cavernae]|nr:DUF2026 family protein [Noviherbaspirillum cavernae]
MPTPRPPIPLADYQRIFRVLKTVLDATDADTPHPSVFFSVAGAHLVEQIYKKKCQPVAGAAFYRMDDAAGTILSFADRNAAHDALSSDKGFHCWILCDGHVIDFTAPLFRESLQARGVAGNHARKMFQKPLQSLADSPLLMREPGDFYMLPNVDLTREILEKFFARDDAADLLNVCTHWYRKPPKDIPREASMARNDGSETRMTLSGISLVGAW